MNQRRLCWYVAVLAALLSGSIQAQSGFSQRGWWEGNTWAYPEAVAGDSGRFIGITRLHYEAGSVLGSSLSWRAGITAETDSHHQVRRDARLFWFDRSLQRPAVSITNASLRYHRGNYTAEAGKQVIRWGQTDLWSPIDRFAPRDFLYPMEGEYLGVTGARLMRTSDRNHVEAVYVPRFTPSRLPIAGQRWLSISGGRFEDLGSRFPGGGQFGVRWRATRGESDYSLAYFEGFNHTPNLTVLVNLFTRERKIRRDYPRMRMAGGDWARVTRLAVLRAEGAWFSSSNPAIDNYVQFVLEAERSHDRFTWIAGYIGEVITERRARFRYAIDRQLVNAFAARTIYSLNPDNELALELLARARGDGYGVRGNYTHRLGRNWKVSGGGVWLRGEATNLLGRFQQNSHLFLSWRYSF